MPPQRSLGMLCSTFDEQTSEGEHLQSDSSKTSTDERLEVFFFNVLYSGHAKLSELMNQWYLLSKDRGG
jgi:hypothetical protein